MMGPLYENVNNHDFAMYFQGALVYKYNRGGTGTLYELSVNVDSPTALAHDTTHRLTARGANWAAGISVQGRDLFLSQEYLLHRLPVEYVPYSNAAGTRVLRLSVEPRDRSAFKGTSHQNITWLPLLTRLASRGLTSEARRAVTSATAPRTEFGWTEVVMRGMVRVLDLGYPYCMRRLISMEEARANCRKEVRRFMRSTVDYACVPDFKTCLIKLRPDEGRCIMVYCGEVVGTVVRNEDDIVLHAKLGRSLRPASTAALYKDAITNVAQSMFVDRVVWSPAKKESSNG